MSQSWIILTSCFFPNQRPLGMFFKSASICGIPFDQIRTYGDGQQFANWTDMKVRRMIPVLEGLRDEGYTHVLYTDGRDVFWVAPWPEIERKLADLHSPLVSAQPECFPLNRFRPNYNQKQRYPFHCPGGYLGPIDWWLEAHRRMEREGYEARECGGDEAGVWQYAWDDGWFRPEIDHRCRIFQNLSSAESDVMVARVAGRGRIVNIHTGYNPTLLHFNGFYTDPISGCYDRMIGWWDRIFPEERITLEECSL